MLASRYAWLKWDLVGWGRVAEQLPNTRLGVHKTCPHVFLYVSNSDGAEGASLRISNQMPFTPGQTWLMTDRSDVRPKQFQAVVNQHDDGDPDGEDCETLCQCYRRDLSNNPRSPGHTHRAAQQQETGE